jgi:UDP-glucose 4-epimerase
MFNLGNGTGFSVREVIAATQRSPESPSRQMWRLAGPATPRSSSLPATASALNSGWEPRKPALEVIVADAWAFAQARPNGYAQ